MSFERAIAWRFLRRGTERGRFNPMTLFAWLAIAIGVWAMGSFLSVMYGFESSLKTRLLKAYPHVQVKRKKGSLPINKVSEWTESLKAVSGVTRAIPYVEAEMVFQSPHRTLGGVVWGVPEEEMLRLGQDVTEGEIPQKNARVPQVLLGVELAHRLKLVAGQELRVISPIQKGGAFGLTPREEVFEVSGLYSSGHYEFDQQYLIARLEDAQDLLKWKDAVSGWHVWGPSLEDSIEVRKKIAPIVPDTWEVEDWTQFNEALFASLKLEQYAMFAILSFAVLIAVMNVVITLMMHVTHKRRNIGILRAIGASRVQIRNIFFWQGVWLGSVGLLIGMGLTVLFLLYLRFFSTYLLPEIYYDRTVPIEIRPLSLLLIYGVAVFLILLGTLYPAARASRIHPVEAIRE